MLIFCDFEGRQNKFRFLLWQHLKNRNQIIKKNSAMKHNSQNLPLGQK